MKERLIDYTVTAVSQVEDMNTQLKRISKYLRFANTGYEHLRQVSLEFGVNIVDSHLVDVVIDRGNITLEQAEMLANSIHKRLKEERGGLINNSKVKPEDLPNVLILAKLRNRLKTGITQAKLAYFKGRKTNINKNIVR